MGTESIELVELKSSSGISVPVNWKKKATGYEMELTTATMNVKRSRQIDCTIKFSLLRELLSFRLKFMQEKCEGVTALLAQKKYRFVSPQE